MSSSSDADSASPAPSSNPTTSHKKKSAPSSHLEGFLHESSLYLKDVKTGAIYHSERDAQGSLVTVGHWSPVLGALFAPHVVHPAPIAADPAPVSKRQKKELALAQLVTRQLPPLNFPVTDVADHAETGIKAYRDIKLVLDALALALNKPDLRLYDPYFCTGRVKEHLARIGYTNVYNENQDFYAKLEAHDLPEYDVLITNPPYSEDHMERLVAFAASQSKPFLLLLPSYVSFKKYYAEYLKTNKPIYCVPKTGRYSYNSPADESQGLRAKRLAPFSSFWYIDAKSHRGALLERLSSLRAALVHAKEEDPTGQICSNLNAVPLRVLDDADPRKKAPPPSKKTPHRGHRGGAPRGRFTPQRRSPATAAPRP